MPKTLPIYLNLKNVIFYFLTFFILSCGPESQNNNSPSNCNQGDINCLCLPNNTCNDQLKCQSNQCIDPTKENNTNPTLDMGSYDLNDPEINLTDQIKTYNTITYNTNASDIESSSPCQNFESLYLTPQIASPHQVVTIQTNCLIDDTLSVKIDSKLVPTFQLTSTVVGFIIPSDASSGKSSLEISQGDAFKKLDLTVISTSPLSVNPQDYINERISLLNATLDDVEILKIKLALKAQLNDLENSIKFMSPQEINVMARFLQANESGLGLVNKSTCSEEPGEKLWKCLSFNFKAKVAVALVGSVFCAAGLQTLKVPQTALISGGTALVGCLTMAASIYSINARNLDAILTIAHHLDVNNVLKLKQLTVKSDQPFNLIFQGDYISLNGYSPGSDSPFVTDLVSALKKGHEIITKLNSIFGEQTKIYTGSESVNHDSRALPQDLIKISLKNGTPIVTLKNVSADGITLTSSSKSNVPVQLLVTYDFKDVRKLETTVDIIIEPNLGCDGNNDGIFSDICEQDETCVSRNNSDFCLKNGQTLCDGNNDGTVDAICNQGDTCVNYLSNDFCSASNTTACDGNNDGVVNAVCTQNATCISYADNDFCLLPGKTPCDGNNNGVFSDICEQDETCINYNNRDICLVPGQIGCDGNNDGVVTIICGTQNNVCVNRNNSDVCLSSGQTLCDGNNDGTVDAICNQGDTCVSYLSNDFCLKYDQRLCDGNNDGVAEEYCYSFQTCVSLNNKDYCM